MNGSPVYKGDTDRVYTSQLCYRMEVSIVKAPVGASLMAKTDDSLTTAMRKLKFGQIGALKSVEVEISNEILYEIIIPVTKVDILKVKDSLITVFNIDKFMSERTCTVNGEPVKLSKLKELISGKREENRNIRERWMKRVKTLSARGASPEDILEEKKRIYSEYVSVSEYSINLSVSLRHIVNNPSLKGTVINNCDQSYYDMVNYKEGSKVRKTARHISPVVSIPVSTLEDYTSTITYIRTLLSGDPTIASLSKGKAEVILFEGNPEHDKMVDFASLRKHDQSLR
jgi:hypothetical protein